MAKDVEIMSRGFIDMRSAPQNLVCISQAKNEEKGRSNVSKQHQDKKPFCLVIGKPLD